MRVLVTGGAGMFGGYTMAALQAAGHDAQAYDLAAPGPEMLSVAPALATRLHLGSIDDIGRLRALCRAERIDAIVHAAARVGMQPSLADPVGFYQTNIMGLVNVCEVARELEMRKLVAVSSNAAYHQGDGHKLVETDPPFSVTLANPAAHYGTSKMAGEAIGLAYAEFHGLDFLALRVTAVYGFGMRNALHLKPVVENAVLGRPTRFATGGSMKRDYTHVLDCARAVVLAIEAPRLAAGCQRVLNVAAGRLCTPSDIADIVRREVPGADIEIGEALTPLEAANVKMRAPLDITMAGRMLNWSPRWPIEAGIRQYVTQYRQFVEAGR